MELTRNDDTTEQSRTTADEDSVETVKRRLKAPAFAFLGRIAEYRNRHEQASRYYELAATQQAELNHVHDAADTFQRAGKLAAEGGDRNAAAQYYEQAVDVLDQTGNPEELLRAIDSAIDARDELGDHEAAMRWCEGALSVAGDATLSDAEDARTHFQLRLADVSDPEGGTPRTYDLALRNVLEADEATARHLLQNVWDRRDEVGENTPVYRLILAAGVAHVTHGRITGDEPDDSEEILDAIELHRKKLSNAATALFDQLTVGETEIETDEFTTDVDPSKRQVALGSLEEAAFATLLDGLHEN